MGDTPQLYLICSHVKNPHDSNPGTNTVTHSVYRIEEDAKHMLKFLNSSKKSKVGFLEGYADADFREYFIKPIDREVTFGETLPSWTEDIKEINRQIEHLYKEMSESEAFAESEGESPAE